VRVGSWFAPSASARRSERKTEWQTAVEANGQISVAHIPGTGHHVRFENYGDYLRAVRVFLAQVKQEA
jgi:hypothetical protein